jgi:hypothetical protein
MTDLDDFSRVARLGDGLCTVTTLRADTTMQASVVSAGVLDHPLGHIPVVGFVAQGHARKLIHLRARPRATIVARTGFQWVAAEGPVQLIGPDDPVAAIDGERLCALLREVFQAAGGTHDDWSTYDRVMAEERRAVVLVHPERVYSNA